MRTRPWIRREAVMTPREAGREKPMIMSSGRLRGTICTHISEVVL